MWGGISMARPAWLRDEHQEFGHMSADVPGETNLARSPGATALYIGTLTAELAGLARRHGLDTLAYILDMARLEADQIAKNSGDAGHA
jgi:hypothetical protein